MQVDTAKIRAEYGSERAYCISLKVREQTLHQLKRKKSNIFHRDSEAFDLYKKMKKDGFINE